VGRQRITAARPPRLGAPHQSTSNGEDRPGFIGRVTLTLFPDRVRSCPAYPVDTSCSPCLARLLLPSTALRGRVDLRRRFFEKEERLQTKIVACVIGLAVLGQSGQGWAGPARRRAAETRSLRGGSVLGTLVYAPGRRASASWRRQQRLRLPIAGPETAGNIVGSTCKGHLAITLDALKGRSESVRRPRIKRADAGSRLPYNSAR